MTFILNHQNSLVNQFLFEVRDTRLQGDRMRFRKNVERLGEILAYEVSKNLEYEPKQAVTPLGKTAIKVLKEQPVLLTILRAGLPFFQGFINFFDQADCGFIGAYRKENEKNLVIELDYVATNSLENKTAILIDPMLATGHSVMDTVAAILKNGQPRHLHLVSMIAAPEGIQHIKEQLKLPFSIWTCAIDEKLNDQHYIVPGLGDAGDLSFGMKL